MRFDRACGASLTSTFVILRVLRAFVVRFFFRATIPAGAARTGKLAFFGAVC